MQDCELIHSWFVHMVPGSWFLVHVEAYFILRNRTALRLSLLSAIRYSSFLTIKIIDHSFTTHMNVSTELHKAVEANDIENVKTILENLHDNGIDIHAEDEGHKTVRKHVDLLFSL